MDSDRLGEHWLADIAVLTPHAGPERWAAEHALLERAWHEPHRRYHTLQHLTEVMAALEELRETRAVDTSGARAARVAAWYHDLAYDPRAAAGSNEHRSAALARDHLHRLGVADEVVALIEMLVLMTADHQRPSREPTARHTPVVDAFHDADLWILAAPAERFDDYCAQVREEYAHVPAAAYAAVRAGILRSLLGGGQVYRTAHARAHWRQRAADNVARELARLV